MSFVRRHTFDPGPAPANYVAGLGRGASGFTTRSDIGEARSGPVTSGKRDEDDDAPADYSESTFDKFSGYKESLFATADYDEADREADSIWEMVDERMNERGQERRLKREREEKIKLRKEAPKVQLEFADLKKKLETLSDDDWMAIPDIGDSHIRKSQRPERFVPVPDSVLASAHNASQATNVVMEPDQSQVPSGIGSVAQDLTSVGKAQKLQLDATLARASSSVGGQSVVNSAGYMTDLNAHRTATEDLVDLNKARDLLKNVTTTNPSHAPGWIAAARLEHIAGNISAARKIMLRGCAACPKNEDVWLEAARLHTPENAKIIFARAVQNVPTSIKLWLSASRLEDNIENKKRVLRKGIELIPKAEDLWKAAIELEDPADAKIMLSKAVECIPHCVDMWLALARLEPYHEARKTLNRAREAVPTDPSIWIAAAQLEESQRRDEGSILKIIARAVKNLTSHHVLISRQKWLEEAYKAERAGFPKTALAIVRETIGIGVEEADRKRTWMADAENAAQLQQFQVAQAIYQHARTVFPNKKGIWRKSAELEKAHGTPERCAQILSEAVQHCPKSEVLWLFAAREKWKTQGDVPGARALIREAFKHNPESERIWLAAVRLETDNGEHDLAREQLNRARQKCGTQKVWIKSCKLERLDGNVAGERKLLQEAVVVHPKSSKLWLMLAQLEEETAKGGDLEHVKDVYQRALKNCPHSVELWVALSLLHERSGSIPRARAVLETARFQNPASPLLWKRAVEIEYRSNNKKIGENMLAKALQECPDSGVVWAMQINYSAKAQQRERCADALRKCDKDPTVLLAVAKVFWADRKLDKARVWLERTVVMAPKLGDAWAYLLMFVQQHDTVEAQNVVVQRAVTADPKDGEMWKTVSKSLEWLKQKQRPTEELLRRVAKLLPPVV